MQQARLLARLQREITMLKTDPPPGVCAWPQDDMLTHLEAQLQGPANTVYSRGLFKLDVQVPERYPFEPPSVRFVTPIYHPNIDSGGRICLDILNMPPKGAWKPSLNILTVLVSIGSLLAEPNPDDGLMGDITAEYKHHRSSFDRKAMQMTEQHALPSFLNDTADQPKAIASSIPKVTSMTTLSQATCVTKLFLGVDHPDSRNQASSSGKSSKITDVPGPSPLKQRLALGRKLSLSKPDQHLADVNCRDPTLIRSLTVDEHENPAQVANRYIATIKKQPETAIQPALQTTAVDHKATPEAQSLGTSLPLSKEVTVIPNPVTDEPAKPSRLSLLSRLKTSRPRLSHQKAVPSSTKPSPFEIQAADCTVVSDSESEDEESPFSRGRLSLTQSRTLCRLSLQGQAGKRKASLI